MIYLVVGERCVAIGFRVFFFASVGCCVGLLLYYLTTSEYCFGGWRGGGRGVLLLFWEEIDMCRAIDPCAFFFARIGCLLCETTMILLLLLQSCAACLKQPRKQTRIRVCFVRLFCLFYLGLYTGIIVV